MQKITPYLWFDDQAEAAAARYTTIFEDSEVKSISRYDDVTAEASGRPAGSAMIVEFQLCGQRFVALNGGPVFDFTPAASFFVSCDTEGEIDRLWKNLSAGGETLMPLQEYPFSPKFGWTQDQYGLSWQLNLGSGRQKITPCLMFVGDQYGKAEQAIRFYQDLFDKARLLDIQRYEPGQGEPVGAVQHAKFELEGQEFMAMDSSGAHHFTFTGAVSFLVDCKNQAEVDRLWENLTAGGEEQPCGWLRDRYGLSWQIVPTVLIEMLNDPDPEKSRRVTGAMLQMKKIDIAALKQAHAG